MLTSEIERVFREEYGRAMAVLVRVFGDRTRPPRTGGRSCGPSCTAAARHSPEFDEANASSEFPMRRPSVSSP
jgi:hypothetical protein